MNSNGVEEPNVSSSAAMQQKIRVDMLNAAKQFMANPRVQQTPVEEQKDFLRKKGLTQAEIEAAFDGIGVRNQMLLNQVSIFFNSIYFFSKCNHHWEEMFLATATATIMVEIRLGLRNIIL